MTTISKELKSTVEEVPFNEDEIKAKYLLPFVPVFLYGPDDFKVVRVVKETFENGVTRSVIFYKKKDLDHPGSFLDLTHYDDWTL